MFQCVNVSDLKNNQTSFGTCWWIRRYSLAGDGFVVDAIIFSWGSTAPSRSAKRCHGEGGCAPQCKEETRSTKQGAVGVELEHHLVVCIVYIMQCCVDRLLEEESIYVLLLCCYNVLPTWLSEFCMHACEVSCQRLDVVFTGVTNEKDEESTSLDLFH